MNIPFKEYRELPQMNWSKLNLLRQSDRSFIRQKDIGVKVTEAMKFGTGYHSFYLEKVDFFNKIKIKEDVLVEEPLNPKNKNHLALLEVLLNEKELLDFRFDLKNKDHVLWLQDEMNKYRVLNGKLNLKDKEQMDLASKYIIETDITRIREKINMRKKNHREVVEKYISENNPMVNTPLNLKSDHHKKYVEENNIEFISSYDLYRMEQMEQSMRDYGMTIPSLVEQTFFGKVNGIDVKCRIDYIDDTYGGDVKTIKRDIIHNDKLLYYTIKNAGYHLQALFYMIIARQNGFNIDKWKLDFIEKDEPFQARTVILDFKQLLDDYGYIITDLTNKVKMIQSDMIEDLPITNFESLKG